MKSYVRSLATTALAVAGFTLASSVQAQLAWNVYNDNTGALVTANAYTGGDTLTGSTVNFTVPANSAYEFVTNNFPTQNLVFGTQNIVQANFTIHYSGGLVGSAGRIAAFAFLDNTTTLNTSATPSYYPTLVNQGVSEVYSASGPYFQGYGTLATGNAPYSGNMGVINNGSAGTVGGVTLKNCGNSANGGLLQFAGGTGADLKGQFMAFVTSSTNGANPGNNSSTLGRMGYYLSTLAVPQNYLATTNNPGPITTTTEGFASGNSVWGYGNGLTNANSPTSFNEFAIGFSNTTTNPVTITLKGMQLYAATTANTSATSTNYTAIQPVNTPYIETAPVSTSVNNSLAGSLSVTAVGNPAITGYQWSLNGTALSDGTAADGTVISGSQTATLNLTNAQGAHADGVSLYTVAITNSQGTTTSSGVTISTPTPASFTGTLPGAIQAAGGSVQLVAPVTGSTPVTYQWYLNGTALTDGTQSDGSSFAGSTSSATLTISSIHAAEAGSYTVHVLNAVNTNGGATSNSANVDVVSIPTQTNSPVVNSGASASFSVSVAGPASPSFQWAQNGTSLSDGSGITGSATSSLSLTTTAAMAGSYTVAVTTGDGSVSTPSPAFLLTVVDTSLGLSGTFPTAGATGVKTDVPLLLTFSSPVTLGTHGTIKVYTSSGNTLVDTIDLAALSVNATPAQNQTNYGINAIWDYKTLEGQVFSYFPIIAGSATVQVQLHNALAYNTQYYVTIDPGVFNDTGGSYAGLTANAYSFTTKASAPSTSATDLYVATGTSGDFATVQGAFDFIQASITNPVTVHIANGTYNQLIFEHGVNNVTLLGQSRTGAILEYLNNNNFDGAGGSYYHRGAVELYSNNLTVLNLTVNNLTPHGGSQAEALIIQGTQNVVSQVNMNSYQDTFLSNNTAGSTYISDCHISGDVDFIWGSGADFFTNCEITALTSNGYYTQIRNTGPVTGTSNHGDVFYNCTVDAAAGVTGSYLARIDPTAGNYPYSEVVYINCAMSNNLASAGWLLNNTVDQTSASAPNVHYWYAGLTEGGTAYNTSGFATCSNPITNGTTLSNYETPSYILGGWSPALAPVFLTQPAALTAVTAGGSFTLTASAAGVPEPTYQWSLNGTALTDGTQPDGSTISGSATGSISVTGFTGAEAGNYTAVATSGSSSTTSSTAVVSLPTAPSITTQPTAQSVAAGSTLTLTVAVSGIPAPSVQWYFNGVAISGATSSTYTLADVTGANQGTYSVDLSNVAGVAGSSYVQVTVGVAPTFTTEPSSKAGLVGYPVSFSAYASASPAPSYQWSLNGTAIGGATSSTYSIASVVSGSAGSYTVTATNSIGSSTSTGATLTVDTVPTIATQPSSQAVAAGSTLTLTVSGSGTPSPTTYQWLLNGSYLSNGGNVSGATSASLVISAITPSQQGNYTVIVGNGVASVTSAAAAVTVGVLPVFTTQPASATGLAGYPVTFAAYASASPAPSYQWSLNGTAIGGATSSTYSIGSVVSGNAGSYTVTATNSIGSTTSSGATLTVDTIPTITSQPASQAITAGSTLTLTVAASGTPSPSTYQWLFNGSYIGGATASSYVLPSVGPANQGNYAVIVGNGVASVKSALASVTVGVAPTFTTQPSSKTGLVGYAISFSSYASASPTPSYQWSLNGTAIGGATSSSYSISSVTTGEAGNYTVTATNLYGSATSSTAVLTVDTVPSITGQPASQVDDTGATVTLTVSASGTPAVNAYQWYVGGSVIAGATSSSYAVANAGQSASGLYQVTVGNGIATVLSNVAVVHVLAPVLTRAEGPVGTGAQGVITSTFTLTGSVRTILILGVGPGLDIGGSLASPTVSLYYGPSSASPLLYTNTNWTSGGNQGTIASMASGHCGVTLSGTSADSAVLAFLPAGTYTAVLSGAGGSTGIGSLQAYDLSNAAYVNAAVQTQSPVTGSTALTQTFLVAGTPADVLVTGLGSGLSGKSIGAPLAEPILTVTNWAGSVVGTNEGYTNAANAAAIATAESTLTGYSITGTDSAVLIVGLPVGAYTATVTSGDSTSGVTEVDAFQQ